MRRPYPCPPSCPSRPAWLALAIIVALAAVLWFARADAAHLHPERWYQAQWCEAHGGEMEYLLPGGQRVDCLTATQAVEHDFARKWYEGVMQALDYARKTGRSAVVVLIVERDEDMEHVDNCRACVAFYGLPVDVEVIVLDGGRKEGR